MSYPYQYPNNGNQFYPQYQQQPPQQQQQQQYLHSPASNTSHPPAHVAPQRLSQQGRPSQSHPVVYIPQKQAQYQQTYPHQASAPAQHTQTQHAHPSVAISQRPHPSQSSPYPLQSSQSPAQRPPTSSHQTRTPTPNSSALQPSTPPQLLYLTLAEEYVRAAHQLGSRAGQPGHETDLKRYHKLMATGLGCFNGVLNAWRMQPRMEALVRLRYATLLSEETGNLREAEESLSKGITLCDRSRLYDLKYSMQHLLARILFQTNPRAASKSIDKVLLEAEAQQHIAWVYAFRFLKITLSLQHSTSSAEVSVAIQGLRGLSAVAERHGDISIYVTCAALEALVHLRSVSIDSFEQAQHAVAAARQYQLGIKGQNMAPITAMLDMVDLACCLQQGGPQEVRTKLSTMHSSLDSKILESSTTEDGSFAMLLDRSSGGTTTDSTGGIFQKSADGRDMLSFSWLSRSDISALGYFLSGVTAFTRKGEQKAEKFLREGLKLIQISTQNRSVEESINTAGKRTEWITSLRWFMNLYLAFILCTQMDWTGARTLLNTLTSDSPNISTSNPDLLTQFTIYLTAITEQGLGNLSDALTAYQSPLLSLPANDTKPRPTDPNFDLRLLSAINQLLILRDPSHPHHFLCGLLLMSLDPLCRDHPNRNIAAAFHLVSAYASSPPSLVHSKQCIQLLLQGAKATANQQLICLAMNAMADRFFKGTAGEQGESCAKTARVLAGRWGDPLWKCVAAELLSETYDMRGKPAEARAAKQEAEALVASLPDGLRGDEDAEGEIMDEE